MLFHRRTLLAGAVAASLAAPPLIRSAHATGTIKLGWARGCVSRGSVVRTGDRGTIGREAFAEHIVA